MKHFTVPAILFGAGMLAVWMAFQLLAPSFVTNSKTVDPPLSIQPAGDRANVPLAAVEARTVAPAPVYDSSGRIVSLNPNGSGNKSILLAPAAPIRVAPVYDTAGRLISDPTGVIFNSGKS